MFINKNIIFYTFLLFCFSFLINGSCINTGSSLTSKKKAEIITNIVQCIPYIVSQLIDATMPSYNNSAYAYLAKEQERMAIELLNNRNQLERNIQNPPLFQKNFRKCRIIQTDFMRNKN